MAELVAEVVKDTEEEKGVELRTGSGTGSWDYSSVHVATEVPSEDPG